MLQWQTVDQHLRGSCPSTTQRCVLSAEYGLQQLSFHMAVVAGPWKQHTAMKSLLNKIIC